MEGVTCESHSVAPSMAHSQHYRADCPGSLRKKCQLTFRDHIVKDARVWRHLETVVKNTNIALENIEFH